MGDRPLATAAVPAPLAALLVGGGGRTPYEALRLLEGLGAHDRRVAVYLPAAREAVAAMRQVGEQWREWYRAEAAGVTGSGHPVTAGSVTGGQSEWIGTGDLRRMLDCSASTAQRIARRHGRRIGGRWLVAGDVAEALRLARTAME